MMAAPVAEAAKTKLSRNYTFWLTINAAGSDNFEDAIKKIGSFDTVEDFWAVYQHLKRPEDIPSKTDYNLVPSIQPHCFSSPKESNQCGKTRRTKMVANGLLRCRKDMGRNCGKKS